MSDTVVVKLKADGASPSSPRTSKSVLPPIKTDSRGSGSPAPVSPKASNLPTHQVVNSVSAPPPKSARGSPASPGSSMMKSRAPGTPVGGSSAGGGSRLSALAVPVRAQVVTSTGSAPGAASDSGAKVDLAPFSLVEIIKGGQGTVFKGVDPETKNPVAVKISYLKDETTMVNAQRERDVFAALKKFPPHKNLISAHLCHVQDGEMITVLDWYPVDMYTILHEIGKTKGKVSAAVAFRLTDQLLEATEALHQRGFVHRDIKPENILLTTTDINQADMILCDYGLCGIISPKNTMLKSSCGSRRYAAPEVWNKEKDDMYDGIKIDIWSIGMVFFCLIAGFSPWESASETDKIYRAWRRDPSVFFDWAKKFSTNELCSMTQLLFRGMCHPVPAERLTIANARKLVRNKR